VKPWLKQEKQKDVKDAKYEFANDQLEKIQNPDMKR